MQVNKHIEKPSYIFGIPAMEVAFIMVINLGFLFLALAIQTVTGFQIAGKAMLLCFLSLWLCLMVLKWATKRMYPGFLYSFIAYKFMQKRKIIPNNYKIKIIKKD